MAATMETVRGSTRPLSDSQAAWEKLVAIDPYRCMCTKRYRAYGSKDLEMPRTPMSGCGALLQRHSTLRGTDMLSKTLSRLRIAGSTSRGYATDLLSLPGCTYCHKAASAASCTT
eukprot:COSAG02_NODE_19267_length_891_cov_1.199495_1_plen_115_part_00